MRDEFDLVVVGGGPSGSSLATFVAMQGHKVLLLERELFPRFQIGESLLPATVNDIARLLGIHELIKCAGFRKKLGATFYRWGSDKNPWTFNFGTSAALGNPDDGFTVSAFQVERSRFDQILLENAQSHGVEVRTGCRALNFQEENDRVQGVNFEDKNGIRQFAQARFVGDASGHQSLLAPSVGSRIYSEFYRNVAVFGYFENGERLPEPDDGNALFETFSGGWFWYIPLSATLTSVGAVLPVEKAGALKNGHEDAFSSYLAECPKITKFLERARRSRENPYDTLRVRKEFSYCQSRFWKPGAFLVGDSACFLDVLMSTGVHLGTYSALLAARSVNTALAENSTRNEVEYFNQFELQYRLEFTKFHQALIGMYDFTKTPDTYRRWLKRLLSQTNGAALEFEFPDNSTQKPVQTIGADTIEELDDLRRFNARVLQAKDLQPLMETVEPIPPINSIVKPGANRLVWNPLGLHEKQCA